VEWISEVTGRKVSWKPGRPWPTVTLEESEAYLKRFEARKRGGYWCNDGQHYTFGSFFTSSCCDTCQDTVDRYYDRLI
jgi:hypothetical protein